MCYFNIFDKKGALVKRVQKGATPIPFHTVHWEELLPKILSLRGALHP